MTYQLTLYAGPDVVLTDSRPVTGPLSLVGKVIGLRIQQDYADFAWTEAIITIDRTLEPDAPSPTEP